MQTKSQSVADVILSQLGGRKFVAMTGAKNLMSHSTGALSFKLPSNFANKGINYVKVALEPNDTYTVTFGKVRGTKYTVLGEYSLVFADSLQQLFSEVTGLHTHL